MELTRQQRKFYMPEGMLRQKNNQARELHESQVSISRCANCVGYVAMQR